MRSGGATLIGQSADQDSATARLDAVSGRIRALYADRQGPLKPTAPAIVAEAKQAIAAVVAEARAVVGTKAQRQAVGRALYSLQGFDGAVDPFGRRAYISASWNPKIVDQVLSLRNATRESLNTARSELRALLRA